MKKDNTTLAKKVSLRHELKKYVVPNAVIETHGGYGNIWNLCYSDVTRGAVFEKDEKKAESLAKQRPGWAVYSCDSGGALRQGAGSHIEANILNVDPYGDPWPFIESFLFSDRSLSNLLGIVVNDGLRHKCKMQGAWSVRSLKEAVSAFGNAEIYPKYVDVCQWNIARLAEKAGYALTKWTGYYCGHNNAMTHYAAVLSK